MDYTTFQVISSVDFKIARLESSDLEKVSDMQPLLADLASLA